MIRSFSAAPASLVAFTLSLTTARAVENTWDYSVQVSSSVQTTPARVTLTWPQDTGGIPASYTVYRKTPGASSWGAGTTVSGTTTNYTDTSVITGQTYEYRIVKAAGAYTGYGYIQVGLAAPVVESRGKVVLVVDNTVAPSLTSELTRLQQDLAGDGWVVVRRDVGRTDSVTSVKAVIKSVYDSDPANVKSVFLFGHVPVPYSGQLNPDGHPDHIGAWPADAYYGDMDGTWTDSSVNYVQTANTDPADAARMSNRPGDGKFDQTTLPSTVELEVGRVDLSNLPGRTTAGGPASFPGEIELLRKYLNKDHNFRHRISNAPRRAVVGDYFGLRGGEAFAASGYRSFAPLVGANNIRNLNTEFSERKGVWISQVSQHDYLLAYGCGAGSYTSISGLGNTGLYHEGSTIEMVSDNVSGVFNLLFGSWLGDWDHEDNILRAPLATDYGLVSAWSGRPHWFMHPLGAGETIGCVARSAMNNTGLYQTQINSSANRIHIALMGDPTLRLHPVAPVSNVNGSVSGGSVALTWTPSADSGIVGCHVYRGSLADGFNRVNSSPVTGTSFTDPNGSSSFAYMVRAIKLEDTTSGSYHNASQGVFWNAGETSSGTTTNPAPPPPSRTTSGIIAWFDDALPAGAGAMTNGDTWKWVTSDPAPFSGSPAHKSDAAGHESP
ncbi:MAG: C25 family cysteine peptidase, partial [Opitutaceae bacterium]